MNLKKAFYQLTHWETWPYRVKYVPIIPAWLWYCLRSRSWWFFTASNPTLTFGGFEGERKSEMYKQLPVATYPKSIYITLGLSFTEVEQMVAANNYTYPFAVKPDIGAMGFMFRKIENAHQLKQYHAKMFADYIIQKWVEYPLEVSVFYYRYPDQQKGTISGFIKKEFLSVIGDGRSTLWELIKNYDRVQYRLPEMKAKHEHRLKDVIAKDEVYILSLALNLSRGGKLISLAHENDDDLLKMFDELSHFTNFYYGRYDIKCNSIEELKQGKFSILEFNGSGAEPHHAYGNGNTLWQAQKIFLHHWKVLYQISKYNHHNGYCYWSYKRGLKFLRNARKEFYKLKALDAATELSCN